MNGISRCPLLRDPEFGDFLLARIARRVRGDGGSGTLGLKMMLVGFRRVVVKGLDEGVRIDLIGKISEHQTIQFAKGNGVEEAKLNSHVWQEALYEVCIDLYSRTKL